jgi:DNA polymerase-1
MGIDEKFAFPIVIFFSVSNVFKYNAFMNEQNDTIYLVDGSSYIHRAYHAIRNLSNSKGLPTNAVLGFTKMLLKLLADVSPVYLAVVFDARGKTFRHELYPDYKANRPPMPGDLALQIPYIKDISVGLGLKVLEKQGFEADDVIGTLVCRCEKKGCSAVIVTGDKDFRQLVSPATSLWDTMKDSKTGYLELREKYGFEPERFIDVMGLSGDTSDNIPGVPGVGEKTGIKLIQSFGTFEGVFEKLEAVDRPKLRNNLETYREQAELSRKLVTIDTSVPLEITVEDLRVGDPDADRLADLFRELEFRDLWNRFSLRGKGAEAHYTMCRTEADIEALKTRVRAGRKVSVDLETTSENPMEAELVGLSFSWADGEACYIPVGHRYPGAPPQMSWHEVRRMLRDVLSDGDIAKVGQNIKYDAEVLARHGVELGGIYFDTMVASYVLNPGLGRHNLDYLAQHYLNHKMISFKEVMAAGGRKQSFAEVNVEQATEYSCEDADITFRLHHLLAGKLREEQNETLFEELEMKLIPVLMDMEMTGIRVDVEFFKKMSAHLGAQMEALAAEIYEEAGVAFNLNSPQQLGRVLFENLELPVHKKTAKSGGYSTDVRVLKKLAAQKHKVPALVLRYRTLAKLKSTYLDALIRMVSPVTGRVHTSFNQTVTATGRLSSSSPNLQNIPVRGQEGKEIRRGFVAGDGRVLVSADYSQVELRVFAHYSGDEVLIDAFKKGEDVHRRTAAEVMETRPENVTPEMRRIAKAINFGIIYGMGARKLADELGIDQGTARRYIEAYYSRYTGVARFRERMIESARKDGYVTTLFNRKRYLPDIHHGNRVMRGEAERMAVNTPIQGTAADLIKKAMVVIHDWLQAEKLETKMLLQVHDELLFEVPEEEVDTVLPMIKNEMESVHRLRVPLEVDIHTGKNWDEAH